MAETLAVMVMVQDPVPVQAPDHPVKVEPEAGVAVSVTFDPLAKPALQVAPQSIPVGLLVTVPVPVPARLTVRTGLVTGKVNVAVTDMFPLRVTEQVVVPAHAPDHPANVEPAAGVAVSVTAVPLAKLALHVVPQLMPVGELVTVPAPVPARVTFSTGSAATTLKVAVTVVVVFMLKTHALVPLQPPDHPAKVEPSAGLAVRVMLVPEEKVAVQVDPQLMPDGLLLTLPLPVPANFTFRETEFTVGGGLLTLPPQPHIRQSAARPETKMKSL